jgi:hypothetical protein
MRNLTGTRVLQIVVTTLCVLWSILWVPANATAEQDRDKTFCTESGHNYEAPLFSMHPVQRPPLSGVLPFAPNALTLNRPFTRVVVGTGIVGMAVRNTGNRRLSSLHLRAIARLTRVNKRGDVRRHIADRRVLLDRIAAAEESRLEFKVGGRPAFYRVTISFFDDGSGDRLGAYSEYFRVVRPKLNPQLVASATTVQRGKSISFRVANSGTATVSFGVPYQVERWERSGWTADSLLTPSGFPTPEFVAGPGASGKCQTLHIPPDAAPGKYRFMKNIEVLPPPRVRRNLVLVARFTIF